MICTEKLNLEDVEKIENIHIKNALKNRLGSQFQFKYTEDYSRCGERYNRKTKYEQAKSDDDDGYFPWYKEGGSMTHAYREDGKITYPGNKRPSEIYEEYMTGWY
jgi:hypothetical protein